MFMDDQPITDEEELMRRLQMRDAVGQMGNQLASGLAGFAGGPGQQSLAQQDPSAFMNAWYKHSTGLNPANYSENPADYGLATPPPPAAPYQHYSATASPMSAPAIEAQSNRQYTPVTVPNDPPGFFGGIGASLGGMPQERQPLWSNVSGPAAPGQRESDWRNDGGVMINDGFGAMPSTANGPGAGYTSQGMDGSVKPIAFSTDADYGARLSTDPYTNPAIQDLIRKQNMAKELQSIGFANDMAKIDRTIGYKQDQSREAQQQKALITSSNPMLSTTAKHAEIDKLQLPEEQKNRMKMEVSAQRFDPKLKQYVPVGHTNAKTGAPEPGELMSRLPSGVDPVETRRFLAESRNISSEDLDKRISTIKGQILSGGKGLEWMSPDMKKEYESYVRLGLMDPVKYETPKSTFNFGFSGFNMGP